MPRFIRSVWQRPELDTEEGAPAERNEYAEMLAELEALKEAEFLANLNDRLQREKATVANDDTPVVTNIFSPVKETD